MPGWIINILYDLVVRVSACDELTQIVIGVGAGQVIQTCFVCAMPDIIICDDPDALSIRVIFVARDFSLRVYDALQQPGWRLGGVSVVIGDRVGKFIGDAGQLRADIAISCLKPSGVNYCLR